jgi:hypothetical protein
MGHKRRLEIIGQNKRAIILNRIQFYLESKQWRTHLFSTQSHLVITRKTLNFSFMIAWLLCGLHVDVCGFK